MGKLFDKERVMKVWTNNKFKGYYPVGTAAVVVAKTADMATLMLNDELEKEGLPRSAKEEDFVIMPTSKSSVRILADGNY